MFSPVVHPFSVQQYRDYADGVFGYSIVLAWPNGVPLLEFPVLDDQTEFIHGQAYYSGLILGLLGLALVVIMVILLRLVDIHRRPLQEAGVKPRTMS